jgi:hypothetical protein
MANITEADVRKGATRRISACIKQYKASGKSTAEIRSLVSNMHYVSYTGNKGEAKSLTLTNDEFEGAWIDGIGGLDVR